MRIGRKLQGGGGAGRSESCVLMTGLPCGVGWLEGQKAELSTRKEEGYERLQVSLLWDKPAEGMGDLSDSSRRQWIIWRQLRWMRGPGDSCFQRKMCQTLPWPYCNTLK